MQIRPGRGAASGAALLLFLALATGCAVWFPRAGPADYREEGLASWYGTDFHGRRTASGERYNMYSMTAAHRTLPLGTKVLVTQRVTGRRIRVRINDRGPFVSGRIIDLSYAAARKLGSAETGVAPVIVEAFLPAVAPVATPSRSPASPTGPRAPGGTFSIQLGSFASRANADQLRDRFLQEFGEVRVMVFEDNRGTWHRVRAGRYATEDQANRVAQDWEARGFPVFAVRED